MEPKELQAIREAGQVSRCHTIPHHGSYSVAEHSWQALMLLRALNPKASPNLIWAVATHDCAERYTGDVPSTMRILSQMVHVALKDLEAKILDKMGVDFLLSEAEGVWLQAIDRLELLMWCYDQKALGNQNVQNVIKTLHTWFRKDWAQTPKPVQDYISTYEWQRTDDILS